MKNIVYLVTTLLMICTLSAQNKNLTLYYPDSTRVVNISGLDSMTIFICGASKVSYGGKDYNTVLIGSQCWLKENLDIGTMIPGVNDQTNNLPNVIEKYCYGDIPSNCEAYGGLYQWDEAMQYVTTEGARGICPTGWHIPTLTEYIELINYVVWDGKALLAIGQGQGTNTTNFSAMLAGIRFNDGQFYELGGEYTIFWSSTLYDVDFSHAIFLFSFGSMDFPGDFKVHGSSVRCIKD